MWTIMRGMKWRQEWLREISSFFTMILVKHSKMITCCGCSDLQTFTPLKSMKGSSRPLTVTRGLKTSRADHTLSGASATLNLDNKPCPDRVSTRYSTISKPFWNSDLIKLQQNEKKLQIKMNIKFKLDIVFYRFKRWKERFSDGGRFSDVLPWCFWTTERWCDTVEVWRSSMYS